MPEETGVVVQSLDEGGGLKWWPSTGETKVSSKTSLVGVDDSVSVVETIAQEILKSREVPEVLS